MEELSQKLPLVVLAGREWGFMFALSRSQKTDVQAGNCGLVLLNQPLVQPPSKAALDILKLT